MDDLINGLSGTSTPQYGSVDLDPGTKGLIQDSVDRANQPYKSSDLDKSASMFMPRGPSQGQANSGLLSAPGAGQAIANKYSQIAGEQIQGMKVAQGRTDQEHQFAQTGMAFNNVMKQQQVQNQNYEAYLQQIKNEQSIRGQTLNGIFGLALGGGGAAFASKGKGKGSSGVDSYGGDAGGADTMQSYGGGDSSGGGSYGGGSGGGDNPSWGGSQV